MAYERKHFPGELEQMQSLSLESKVRMSIRRIRDWYEYWDGNVCVSFSGGKDSTVLLDLVRSVYPDVRAVFSNTGLEYPEIQRFAMSKPNVDVVTPKMRFPDVVTKYGYPLISKEAAGRIHLARKIGSLDGIRNARKRFTGEWSQTIYSQDRYLPIAREIPAKIDNACCYTMKKSPIRRYYKDNGDPKPFLGTLAEESQLRKTAWERNGCNAYDTEKPRSAPMSFWTEQDVLSYIVRNGLEICSVYGDIVTEDEDGMRYVVSPINLVGNKLKCSGYQRTGCIFCAYGLHLDKGETRFQRLAKTHPKQYDYCMRGGQWVDNPDYDPTAPKMDGDWKNWNPKKIWVPSKEGLGMKKVFDMVNEIYGKDFYRYD